MEHLKNKLEERRLQHLKQPTIAKPKKEIISYKINNPEWYKTPTLEERQALIKSIKLSREKIKAKKEKDKMH